jgi:hypothetical protein
MNRSRRSASLVSALAILVVLSGALEAGADRSPEPQPKSIKWLVMGDTQTWAVNFRPASGLGEFPAGVESFATWIQTNQKICELYAAKAVAGVLFVGDMFQNPKSRYGVERAREALAVLDDCGTPFYVLPGNHDEDRVERDWHSFNALRASFAFQPEFRSQPLADPESSPGVYLGKLGHGWWVFGAGYPSPRPTELAWYDEQRAAQKLDEARVIWLHHDCATALPTAPLRGHCDDLVHDRAEFKLTISGHWCCGFVRRTWGIGPTLRAPDGSDLPREGARDILKVYSNDQMNDILHGWTTELELKPGGAEVCLEAFHPVTGKRGYERIAGKPHTGRAAAPARQCFAIE